MVRMIRKAQVDSSDGAGVRAWINDYTGLMQQHSPDGIEVRAWMQAYGAYGVAFWTFDAPDIASLDAYLGGLGQQPGMADVLLRGSSLFVSGKTEDTLLKEVL
jgi:hypothetical protein